MHLDALNEFEMTFWFRKVQTTNTPGTKEMETLEAQASRERKPIDAAASTPFLSSLRTLLSSVAIGAVSVNIWWSLATWLWPTLTNFDRRRPKAHKLQWFLLPTSANFPAAHGLLSSVEQTVLLLLHLRNIHAWHRKSITNFGWFGRKHEAIKEILPCTD